MKFVGPLVFCFVLPSALIAQSVDPTDLRNKLLRASSSNWYVRIALRDSSFAEGRIWTVKPNSVVVGRTDVPLDDVLRMERRTSTGGSKLVGAAVGALIVGYALGGLGADPDSGGTKGIIPIFGAIGVGAGLGMVFGSIISPGKPQWTQTWP